MRACAPKAKILMEGGAGDGVQAVTAGLYFSFKPSQVLGRAFGSHCSHLLSRPYAPRVLRGARKGKKMGESGGEGVLCKTWSLATRQRTYLTRWV